MIKPWKAIITPISLLMTPSRLSRGGLSMMPGSGSSTPKAKAGRLSVARLIHRIWMGRSGSPMFRIDATNMASISPTLNDRR